MPPVSVPFTDLAAMTTDVRQEVDEAWRAVLAASDFVGGVAVERFEQEWADYCGCGHAIAVANGTDALTLTLRALGIGPGDEVVVPANTFVATVEAIVLAGATPRFSDVDPDTLLLTPDALTAAIGRRTSAVVAVHLYGQTVDTDAVGRVAQAAGLAVVEDAAQAHGATWRGHRAGSLGIAGCFSFYPGKNLGSFGDAGAIVTSDAALAGTLRSLRNHGRLPRASHLHGEVGTNSRMDTIQAAVLSAKLRHLDRWTAARRRIVARYRQATAEGPVRLVAVASGAEPAPHLAVALAPDRDGLRSRLTRRGVATAVHYPVPCHRQRPYGRFADRSLPVAEAAADQVLSLPLFPHMTDAQVDQVCGTLRDCADPDTAKAVVGVAQ
jgi:dTDP-4-amino-4,6-dideoxygalactose transaminase